MTVSIGDEGSFWRAYDDAAQAASSDLVAGAEDRDELESWDVTLTDRLDDD